MTTREELRGSLRRLVSTFLLGKIGLDLLNVIRMPSTFPPLTDELADEILALLDKSVGLVDWDANVRDHPYPAAHRLMDMDLILAEIDGWMECQKAMSDWRPVRRLEP